MPQQTELLYTPPYYYTTKECPNTLMVTMILEDTVDGDALNAAVQRAIRRYPYFSVALKIENEDHVHVPNDRPVVVRKWCGPARLGTEETNGHIQLVSYAGNRICFEIVHHVTDSSGFFPYIKTTLYYYLTEKYGAALDPAGINLEDTPFHENETADPFEGFDLQNIPAPEYEYQRKKSMVPDDAGIALGQGNTTYWITVDEAQLMELCRKNGASPNSALSVMMMQVFRRLVPDSEEPIVSGIATNQKKVLGKPFCCRLGSSRVYADYTKAEEALPFSVLSEQTRKSIRLQNQLPNILTHARMDRMYIAKANSIPSLQKRNALFGLRKYARPLTSTYDISYVHQTGWGDLERYIRAAFTEVSLTMGNSVLLEINGFRGKFDIAFIQGFEDDKIVNAFLALLAEYGIDASMVEKKAECTSYLPVFPDA